MPSVYPKIQSGEFHWEALSHVESASQSLHRRSGPCQNARGFDVKAHAFSVIYVNYIFLARKIKELFELPILAPPFGIRQVFETLPSFGKSPLSEPDEGGLVPALHSHQAWSCDVSSWVLS